MPFDASKPEPAAQPSEASTAGAPGLEDLDRRLRGHWAHLLGGQSPWAALQAWEDWLFHMGTSPGRQLALAAEATDSCLALWRQALSPQDRGDWAFLPAADDRRFRSPAWDSPPYSLFVQAQLAMEAQWRMATANVRGVANHHARRVEFMGRLLLNSVAPVNFPWSNPEVADLIWRSAGANILTGARLLTEDLMRLARGERVAGFDDLVVGKTLATAKGVVVYRNRLMEVIQYAPATPTVHREPILIVPAWIMKYYILDLTPAESLVRYLVEAGFTVFIISWKNPGAALADTAFEDYRRDGVLAALDVVAEIVPGQKVHAVGYCLGGTVLAIAAAALDRDGQERLKSLTLLAAQTDFEEAGELMLFIDESQLAILEDMMHVQGYLDTRQMAGVFDILRANELVFARFVERYLLARPKAPSGLDAWLADPTRMPARMHSEYLRRLFLENSFAHGAYEVDGRAVALKDIRTPIFALGAERDHIAPWRSVHKIEVYSSAPTTFVLTGGGHNTSVLSPPGKAGAYYRVGASEACGPYVDPETWLATAPKIDGSWWPAWKAWLKAHSSGGLGAPPRACGERQPLGPAPGTYVFER